MRLDNNFAKVLSSAVQPRRIAGHSRAGRSDGRSGGAPPRYLSCRRNIGLGAPASGAPSPKIIDLDHRCGRQPAVLHAGRASEGNDDRESGAAAEQQMKPLLVIAIAPRGTLIFATR